MAAVVEAADAVTAVPELQLNTVTRPLPFLLVMSLSARVPIWPTAA